MASIDEAIALRAAGVEASILVLFRIPRERIAEAARNSIHVSVTDAGPIQVELEQDGVNVEVEVETGLTRGGVKPDELPAVLSRLRTSKWALGPIGIWTHMASPEDNQPRLRRSLSSSERSGSRWTRASLFRRATSPPLVLC